MTWIRLDDGFVRHPRMVAAGLHGRALFIAGLCYCGAHLTDGRIPKAVLPVLAAEAGVRPSTWKTLVKVGSWIEIGDEFEVHDYLTYNPSRVKVLSDRMAGAERQRRSRSRRDSSVTATATHDVSARDPSHPIPIPPSGSRQNHRDAPPAHPDEDHNEDLWTLLATRRMTLEQHHGTTITHPDRYRTTVADDYRQRLHDTAEELRRANPDWSTHRLADELDPTTAEHQHTIPDAQQTAAWLNQRDAIEAVPMPPELRRAAR